MWIAVPVGMIAGILVVYLGIPWCYTKYLRLRVAAKCSRSALVVLTFDDGPGARLTPRILACLRDHGVTATFFLLSRNLDGSEALVRRAAELGHVIGCHGAEHVHHWKTPPWAGIRDIRACWRRVREVTGQEASRLPFRPPYGKLNLLSLIYLWLNRTPIVMWTVDGGDTRSGRSTDPSETVLRLRRGNGGLLLLHDFDRADESVDGAVLGVLQAVLRLKDDGLSFTGLERIVQWPRQA